MNVMKLKLKPRMRAMVASACLVAACGLPVLAQDNGTPLSLGQGGPPQGGPGGGGAQMAQQMLERLTKDLSLTTDQVAQVKTILDAESEQMTALRNDTSSSQSDKRTKMMTIRKETQTKIRAILTDDQKTKFDEIEARMQQGRGGPPGGGSSGSSDSGSQSGSSDGPPSGPPRA